ncbi:MAG TPA: malto-oligosyltrehalose trehalohydrolase, partial [Caldilineaceae bacterium]|nr:malto-oligosyltrehalose trehalohydrolase [Caldilineaceae bacterium]
MRARLREQAYDVADLSRPLGATYLGDGRCNFHVWAPFAKQVELRLLDPAERVVEMHPQDQGYFQVAVAGVNPGARYFYRLDGGPDRPDPASRLQPEGVHGPSAVVDPAFEWNDGHWNGLPLQQYILYELHVGTFSEEGTFEGIIPHLDRLVDLGVTAIELMPLAQFPGTRNWGYDGAYPFAIQNSYGGPQGLKTLVNACHQRGLAVCVDVVYNHLGPEGNYLSEFGPYFTDRYKTLWGSAVNYDGPYSDDVRRYFIEHAVYMLRDCHVDMLRLDAVDAILDYSARPFLEELATVIDRERAWLNRQVYLIAETSTNDPRLVQPLEMGGTGLDGQWNDEFHHALHTLLTGERMQYYADYVDPDGSAPLWYLAKAMREGYIYTGQFSRRMHRRHGRSSRELPSHRFVVFAQNHDHVGNRMMGDRLSTLVSLQRLKLAAAAVLLSPYIPLLFMGEEYGETNPFLYFVSHTDPDLVEAVRRGRREEFAEFHTEGEAPDPQAEETFNRSKLNHALVEQGWHRELYDFHKELIRLRKTISPLRFLSKDHMDVEPLGPGRVLYMRRWFGDDQVMLLFNFDEQPLKVKALMPDGWWRKILDTSPNGNGGPDEVESRGMVELIAPATSVLLYRR